MEMERAVCQGRRKGLTLRAAAAAAARQALEQDYETGAAIRDRVIPQARPPARHALRWDKIRYDTI